MKNILEMPAIYMLALMFCSSALATDNSIEMITAISKGDRVLIDLNQQCAELINGCTSESAVITLHPEEGVLFDTAQSGVWAYQHAGTSDINDRFEVELFQTAKIHDEVSVIKAGITVEVVQNIAKVNILSPADGESVAGDSVSVSYTISGSGYDHLHLELISQNSVPSSDAHPDHNTHSGHVSLYGAEGTHVFKNLGPGEYAVNATLARSDHRQMVNSRVIVEFTVIK